MKYAQSVEGFYILLLHSKEQVYNNKISKQLFHHVLGSTKLCFLLVLQTNLDAISLAKRFIVDTIDKLVTSVA